MKIHFYVNECIPKDENEPPYVQLSRVGPPEANGGLSLSHLSMKDARQLAKDLTRALRFMQDDLKHLRPGKSYL